jgi:hypothetical protein
MSPRPDTIEAGGAISSSFVLSIVIGGVVRINVGIGRNLYDFVG